MLLQEPLDPMDHIDLDAMRPHCRGSPDHCDYEMPYSSWHEHCTQPSQNRFEVDNDSHTDHTSHVAANRDQLSSCPCIETSYSPPIAEHNVDSDWHEIVEPSPSLQQTPLSDDDRLPDPTNTGIQNETVYESFFSASTMSSIRSKLFRNSRDWISQQFSWRMSGTQVSPNDSFDDSANIGDHDQRKSTGTPPKEFPARTVSINPWHYFKHRKNRAMSKSNLFRKPFQHREKRQPVVEEPTQLHKNVAPVRPERPPRYLCPNISTESLTSNNTHHRIRAGSDLRSITSSDTPMLYNRWIPLSLGLGSIVQRARSKGNNTYGQSPQSEQKSFISSLDLAQVTRNSGTVGVVPHAPCLRDYSVIRTQLPRYEPARVSESDGATIGRLDTVSRLANCAQTSRNLSNDGEESFASSERLVTMCSDAFFSRSELQTYSKLPDTEFGQRSKEKSNLRSASCQSGHDDYFPNDSSTAERYVQRILKPDTYYAGSQRSYERENSTFETHGMNGLNPRGTDVTAQYQSSYGPASQPSTLQQSRLTLMAPPPLRLQKTRQQQRPHHSSYEEFQRIGTDGRQEPSSESTPEALLQVACPLEIHDQSYSSSTISTPRVPDRIFTTSTYDAASDTASMYTDISVVESEPDENNAAEAPEDYAINATDRTMKELLTLLSKGEERSETTSGEQATIRCLSDTRRKGIVRDVSVRIPDPVLVDFCVNQPQRTMIPKPARDLRQNILIESTTSVTGEGFPRKYITRSNKSNAESSSINLYTRYTEPSPRSQDSAMFIRTCTAKRRQVDAATQTEPLTGDTLDHPPSYRGYQRGRANAIQYSASVSPVRFLTTKRLTPLSSPLLQDVETDGSLSHRSARTIVPAMKAMSEAKSSRQYHMQSAGLSIPVSTVGQTTTPQPTAVPDFPSYLAALRDRRTRRTDHNSSDLADDTNVPFTTTDSVQSQVKDKQVGLETQDDGPANTLPGAWVNGKHASSNEATSMYRMSQLKRRHGMDFMDGQQGENATASNMF